ncbi:MAG TPA: hypothetical protein VHF27_04940 [Acidimicrobiales bacterium]|nr:hypothetical protein [Acidimicrobiales bacterium]
MSDRVPPQRGFTIVTRIVPDHTAELAELLDSIGGDITRNPHIPFVDLDRLHYSSMIVIEDGRTDPYLLFEGSIDGEVHEFLRDLVTRAAAGVGQIFQHCAGYPASGTEDHAALVEYLVTHDIGPGAMFVAWPGRTVTTIRQEEQLRVRIGQFLDEAIATTDLASQPPQEVRRRIQDFVRREPSLEWAQQELPRPFLVKYGAELAVFGTYPILFALYKLVRTAVSRKSSRTSRLLAKLVLSALGSAVGGLAAVLRYHEIQDDKKEARRTPDWQARYAQWSEALGHVVEREDFQLQNHLASVTFVKPGRFRLTLLKVVFAVVILAVRLVANRGKLGGITSVHFARWVLTSNDTTVVFLSNFDGSWESYLNDFIDLAAFGLNAVWANTDNAIGYPPAKFLILEGARDGDRLKAFARYSQVRSRVWYSAYPDLTVANIGNNIEIREKLFADLDDQDTETWLRRL